MKIDTLTVDVDPDDDVDVTTRQDGSLQVTVSNRGRMVVLWLPASQVDGFRERVSA